MFATRRTAGLLLAGALAACGGDGTGPSAESLTGTWHATVAEFVSVANPAVKSDLVAMGGSLVLTLNANKTFSLTTTIPGDPVETQSGTWSSSTDVLTLTYGSGEAQFDLSLSGSTLRLTGANGDFDVNDDGIDEAVKINLTMTRS